VIRRWSLPCCLIVALCWGGTIGWMPSSASALQTFGEIGETLFGECTFDTTVADPTATIRVVTSEGKDRYRLTLTRSQLTPGNR